MDNNNDVRMALIGLRASMDNLARDLARLAEASDQLAGVVRYADQLVDELPAMLDQMVAQAEQDPIVGMMLAGPLRQLADLIKAGHARRRESTRAGVAE